MSFNAYHNNNLISNTFESMSIDWGFTLSTIVVLVSVVTGT
jgi:hypothetical protein